jgi:dihydroorotate dehydrogenase electron transfer subunit
VNFKKSSLIVPVVNNVDLGGRRFRLSLKADALHLRATPGQFFNLAFPDASPYLPRPFSLYEKHPENQTIDFLIADVGQGTAKFRNLKKGDLILLVGPLGQGFPLDKGIQHHIYVAGSIGVAPFVELHKKLRELNPKSKQTLIYGARKQAELVDLDFLESFPWTLKTCTDDGSSGFQGQVTDLLDFLTLTTPCRFYSCGPTPMMRAVAEKIHLRDQELFVSLEEHMACGIGICRGCVLYNKQSRPSLKTVCCQGPVFDSREIFPSNRKM